MTIAAMKKLLVLDQDTLGENFLKQTLNLNGYEIIRANSSAEGILTSQTWNPDVIIINIMQPIGNGWKLCKKIKEYCQAPILVLAAVSDPISIARWLDAGADDYLTKPFSSEMLLAHLQKLTRRTKIIQNNPSLSLAR
jgi:DNA-binding response OmpR family regulator